MVIYHYNYSMIDNVLKKRNITVYKLAQETGIPYATLRDIINGKVDVSKCQIGNIEKIADCLQLTIDETYGLLKREQPLGKVKGPKSKQRGLLVIRDKKYYLLYRNKYTEICKVTPINSMYAASMAGWLIDEKVDSYRVKRVMREGMV